ncbi:MAG: hypothetical protein ACTH58_16635 [Marinomonas foliarum]|uniref:hypothetical protein n=1 Tax=Marinomonas foliarum TaxID=491950 RepID=UPI001A2137DC|nr:hypothetical protein [Vibrio vulnificus]
MDDVILLTLPEQKLPQVFTGLDGVRTLDQYAWSALSAPIDAPIAKAIIITQHADQRHLSQCSSQLQRHLDCGGRIHFNGHLLYPLFARVESFKPLTAPRRHDFELTALKPHPVFNDVVVANLSQRKGVHGFYGRGYMPLPAGATALTGLGPERLPIDWEWRFANNNGCLFVHAGNDLWTVSDDAELQRRLAFNIVQWCRG